MRLLFAATVILTLSACEQGATPPKATDRAGEPDSVFAHSHCVSGCPSGTDAGNNVIERGIYTLSSNDETKLADWVAYAVSTDTIGSGCKRNWRADPELEDTLEPGDYKGANSELKVDRGHQAPLASLCGTEDWREANYLSNITPQASALNQGPWRLLESAVREHAQALNGQEVRVITGPLYERDFGDLPGADESHEIPSAYWKVAYTRGPDGLMAAAFIMEQTTPRSADFCDFQSTIDEIEQRTGFDLSPGLAESEELRLGGDNFICL